jgi:hypothetical protein
MPHRELVYQLEDARAHASSHYSGYVTSWRPQHRYTHVSQL